MTVSAAKPEEKRLGWFVPTAVDQAESCVKPAAEGRNLARMPNPQHSETERLDHGPNWLKHTEDGLLLGECRLRGQYPKAQTKFWMSRHIIHALPKFARRCELALTKRLLSRALRKLNMQRIFSRIGWARGKKNASESSISCLSVRATRLHRSAVIVGVFVRKGAGSRGY